MAVLHTDADISPTKRELLEAWVPLQSWGSPGPLERVATFRLDDPAGEVGMETMLLRAGDDLLHVPLCYRGAPLDDGVLVGEMEHTALGHRWVYDGASDPVYLDTVRQAIVDAGRDAELLTPDGAVIPRGASNASVRGSGVSSDSVTGAVRIIRRPLSESGVAADAAGTLDATWAGQADPVVLVTLTR